MSRAAREKSIETMKRRLNSRTKGLLDVYPAGDRHKLERVDYLHRTARDWILSMWDDICSNKGPSFDPYLALLKAEALLTSTIADSDITLPSCEIFWIRVSSLFTYASRVGSHPDNIPILVQILDRVDDKLTAISLKKSNHQQYDLYDSVFSTPHFDQSSLSH